mgnify:CR=1 FL=1
MRSSTIHAKSLFSFLLPMVLLLILIKIAETTFAVPQVPSDENTEAVLSKSSDKIDKIKIITTHNLFKSSTENKNIESIFIGSCKNFNIPIKRNIHIFNCNWKL